MTGRFHGRGNPQILEAPGGADHYIWDVVPGTELPEELIRSCPERHLILIERSRLTWLGERRLDSADFRTGLLVMTKRLEQGTFSWPRGLDVRNGKLHTVHRQTAQQAYTL